MSDRRMSTRKQSDVDRRMSSRNKATDKIPVFGIAGAKRNKNLEKMKQDIEERARSNVKTKAEPLMECMYVDATRNTGVVLGRIMMINFWHNWRS